MNSKLNWAFFGSSLVSSYWNGAATYYRGIIKELAARGHDVTFYEPDAYDRQKKRDIPDPEWAKVRVYRAEKKSLESALEAASQHADIIVKASGVGVFDDELETYIPQLKKTKNRVIYWDVDAPATLDRVQSNSGDPFRNEIPRYDLIFTYGGGEPVVSRYLSLGAKACHPIYNALDPSTHYRVEPQKKFQGTLGFLGNRLPDREKRVEDFFFEAAKLRSSFQEEFLLGGSGWSDKPMPNNIKQLGHVYTHEHNAFNSSLKAVLNLSRESMAKNGFSPATRVFEAAGAKTCIITDEWKGIELFLEPGKEVLVANTSAEIAEILDHLDKNKAAQIGHNAFERVQAHHTYRHRAEQIDAILEGKK